MKLRDVLFIVIGCTAALVGVQVYTLLKPPTIRSSSDMMPLSLLNDEISRQRTNAIVLAAHHVGPSVVSITVTQTAVVPTSPFPFTDEFFRDFFRDFFPEYYAQKQIKNLGSGVLISPQGHILTNEHVIANATDITITVSDGRQFNGTIVAADHTSDVALLMVDERDLPYAELGNSNDLMIGEWVIALGNPFGFLLEDTRPSVTVGVVSALNRTIKSTSEDRVYKNMIQTDASINPGNSGGPLVNILGQVVGINTAIFTSGGGSEGIGFALPINAVKRFIDEAQKFGRVRTPWIGIQVQDITTRLAESRGIKRAGVLVGTIDKKSPAFAAGIREADRIVALNGHSMGSVVDWQRCLSTVFVDDTLRITLLRESDSLTTEFVVKEYTESNGGEKNVSVYGIEVENITMELKRQYNLGHVEGVVITSIEPRSLGEKVGLMAGDVLLQVGNTRIKSKHDFYVALQGRKNIDFIIDRGGLIMQLYLNT
jgi:serine protease Do